MGTVCFGAAVSEGKYCPTITIERNEHREDDIVFVSNIMMDTEEDARQVVDIIHRILSGPQDNLQVHDKKESMT